ncbi:hypothetical protein G6O69_15300 [Pseudenhygromyxa sp. WMMC2535]|uniref:hypothetical protein n=1 Tax=Pseudenhygromyxa sp. WMMC2535 TaxID=2712867 RepID=UPI001552D3E0|nr:hypothetical protein [Pseudenhygromyxa sp. WMMC2535]NVB39208.1 hypothetical protein [Pseudenhygromyxa sp. WMMC2535]
MSLPLLLAFLAPACEAEPGPDGAGPGASLELAPEPGAEQAGAADVLAAQTLASEADAVFIGRVVSITHQLSSPDEHGQRLPFTVVTWEIEDELKGLDGEPEYAARFLGGPLTDGKVLQIAEIPTFELGDRDLIFAAGNGERGCPLVEGAKGRVQLLEPGETGDGVSAYAPRPGWAAAIIDELRELGLDGADVDAEAAPVLDLDAPFSFAGPRQATPDELAAAYASAQAHRAPATVAAPESEAERAERTALEANDFNPVLPR